MKTGDKVKSKSEIVNCGGSIILEKGQEVTIRDVLKTPAHWSKICPDIWEPEKINSIRLVGIYGDWQPDTFGV